MPKKNKSQVTTKETTTYRKDQPETIQSMFNNIAKTYDRTNAILSFQMHKCWNARLVREVIKHKKPYTLLDLCCGTGDIGFTFLNKSSGRKSAVMLDFCVEMLDCAREKANKFGLNQRHHISYLKADAHHIPLGDHSMDCATMAYGIRNVKDPKVCIAEVFRVLKPHGTFGILELTQPNNVFLKFGHKIYLNNFLPIIGKFVTKDQKAYEYLCNSIQSFVKPEELEQLFKEVGFVQTARIPLSGGIATIIIGRKP